VRFNLASTSRLIAVFATVALASGIGALAPTTTHADSSVSLTIHYWRSDGQYTSPGTCTYGDSPTVTNCGWNLWAWDYSGGGSGVGYAFTGPDAAYGGIEAQLTIPCTTCTTLGFIIRDSTVAGGEWAAKDTASDRHIAITNGSAEVWVVAGDPTNYASLADAVNARHPRIDAAYLDGLTTITVGMSTDYLLNGQSDGFKVMDATTHKNLAVTTTGDGNNFPAMKAVVAGTFQSQLGDTNWDVTSTKTAMKRINGDLYEFDADLNAGSYVYQVVIGGNNYQPGTNVSLQLQGKEEVNFWFIPYNNQVLDSVNNPTAPLPKPLYDNGLKSDVLAVHLKTAPKVSDKLVVSGTQLSAVTVIPRNVLNAKAYYYSGALGSTWSKPSTSFGVWAPTATKVSLQLFSTETATTPTKTVGLKKAKGGAWTAKVKGNLQNWYYLYAVTIDGVTQTGVDPYAEDTSVNGTRAMIVNLAATNPSNWSKDTHVSVANPVDASIYETDVRDFSIDANSGVNSQYAGKYMAFTQTGTTNGTGQSTMLDSVKALHVKDIELMPTYEFASVDETNNTQQNWGYDPRDYNTPEGQYATDPHGTTRITEYKKMVHAIHAAGMGVIFDGVYTHVADAGTFNPFVNEYYLRTDDFGGYLNGTGAGPDVAIERPMVQRFVEDSMIYWVKQYHVDGFRLDWMSLFGRGPLGKISAALHKVLPGIVIVGEPWLASGDANAETGVPADQQVTEGNQAGLGVGVWNDHFRNAICCGAFDTNPSFATGNPHNMAAAGNNLPANRDALLGTESGIAGSIDYNSGAGIYDFAAAPSETLNYATSHDGYTLWDRINDFSDASASTADKISMDEFTQAIVFTAQGIPMMLSGEEFLRSKADNANSFNAGDAVNELNWSLKTTNSSVFNYYAGLNALRDAHPAFRMTTAAQIKSDLTFLSSTDPTVAYELNGSAVGDSWNHIIVIDNPAGTSASQTLPSGTWDVVGTNGQIGTTTLSTVSGSVQVPAYTEMVLHS
jgi:pullulanase